MTTSLQQIRVIDSHTAGEPTRMIVAGGPDLGNGPLPERVERFHNEHDAFRCAVVNEPRGSDVLVGGILLPPCDPTCVTGVIYFNNVGYLKMCGHGTIGLVVTLAHLGRIAPGVHRIETPVGVVTAKLHEDGAVSITNVPSFRKVKGATIDVPGIGPVKGDVAWGGNWFFLIEQHGQTIDVQYADQLADYAWRVRQAVNAGGFPEVDHLEMFAPPSSKSADSRNFVLCPGRAYDRSPCGTGTSAKLACLFADGKLREGETWRQEGILGGIFQGSVAIVEGQVVPTITGRAYITGEATLLIDPTDPLAWGISR